ncbi:MAG TPA: CPBP family glutamic-type intramembrane protease [Spirochaetota bacterium]|nr:CPBP family glutamic-type intramembrane protease [Spirochaetota bacterium]
MPWLYYNAFKKSFKNSPLRGIKGNSVILLLFSLLALTIGFYNNVFVLSFINSFRALILPVTMFVMPCFMEEFFFRGIFMALFCWKAGLVRKIFFIIFSSVIFTAWHPLNAGWFNESAETYFYNPSFLMIVFALGLVCSIIYLRSKSFWAPVIVHWLVVMVWVFLLNGHNTVKNILF